MSEKIEDTPKEDPTPKVTLDGVDYLVDDLTPNANRAFVSAITSRQLLEKKIGEMSALDIMSLLTLASTGSRAIISESVAIFKEEKIKPYVAEEKETNSGIKDSVGVEDAVVVAKESDSKK